MNTKTIVIVTIILNQTLFSQNLVKNYSFEDTIQCPFGTGQISLSAYWYSPNLSSPDYFNQCASSPISVPSNFVGYQYAKTGIAYSGIGIFARNLNNFREYISSKLIAPLDSGKIYCIEFYLSPANFCKYLSSSICVLFSDTISEQTFGILPHTPQLCNNTNNIISDTANWTLISWQYMAQGGEKFITIGNFFDDFNTIIDSINTLYYSSYYYIDDVTVIECIDTITPEEPLGIPNVFTPNGDGLNDLFEIKGLQKGDKINIYNRWGTNVFNNENEHAYWDGYTTSGEPCSSGTYFYTIDFINGERKSGYLQLVK
jgi:gliding motility-associated-like protein